MLSFMIEFYLCKTEFYFIDRTILTTADQLALSRVVYSMIIQ